MGGLLLKRGLLYKMDGKVTFEWDGLTFGFYDMSILKTFKDFMDTPWASKAKTVKQLE